MADYTRRMLRGSGIIFASSLVASVIGYLIRLVLARGLTPAEFGLFYAVFSFISFFIAFRGLGANSAVAKFVAEFRVKKDWQGIKNVGAYYLVLESAVYAVMVIGFLAFAAPLGASYFKDAAAPGILVILLIAFGFSMLESLYGAWFHGMYQMRYYALQTLLRNVFVLVVSWALLAKGFGVIAPAYAYVIAYALTGILSWWWWRKAFPQGKSVRVTRDLPLFKRMMGYGASVMAGTAATSGLTNIDTIILTSFRSLTEVGWYNTALPTSNVVRSLFRSVATVMFPLSSELQAEGNAGFGAGIAKLYRYIFAMVVPISVGLATLAPTVLSLFFGESYDPAAPALVLLSIGAIFSTILMVASNILMGIGSVKANSAILIGGSVLSVIGNLSLVPAFGITGAAGVNAACQFLMMAASLAVLNRRIKTHVPWGAWLRTALAAALIPLIVWAVRTSISLPAIPALALSVVAGAVVYLGAVWFLRVVTFRELSKLWRVVTGIRE